MFRGACPRRGERGPACHSQALECKAEHWGPSSSPTCDDDDESTCSSSRISTNLHLRLGEVSRDISDHISLVLSSFSMLRRSDFDGQVRQYLHAICSVAGLEGVRAAMELLCEAVSGKTRADVKTWPAYFVALFKRYFKKISSEARQSRVEKLNARSLQGRRCTESTAATSSGIASDPPSAPSPLSSAQVGPEVDKIPRGIELFTQKDERQMQLQDTAVQLQPPPQLSPRAPWSAAAQQATKAVEAAKLQLPPQFSLRAQWSTAIYGPPTEYEANLHLPPHALSSWQRVLSERPSAISGDRPREKLHCGSPSPSWWQRHVLSTVPLPAGRDAQLSEAYFEIARIDTDSQAIEALWRQSGCDSKLFAHLQISTAETSDPPFHWCTQGKQRDR